MLALDRRDVHHGWHPEVPHEWWRWWWRCDNGEALTLDARRHMGRTTWRASRHYGPHRMSQSTHGETPAREDCWEWAGDTYVRSSSPTGWFPLDVVLPWGRGTFDQFQPMLLWQSATGCGACEPGRTGFKVYWCPLVAGTWQGSDPARVDRSVSDRIVYDRIVSGYMEHGWATAGDTGRVVGWLEWPDADRSITWWPADAWRAAGFSRAVASSDGIKRWRPTRGEFATESLPATWRYASEDSRAEFAGRTWIRVAQAPESEWWQSDEAHLHLTWVGRDARAEVTTTTTPVWWWIMLTWSLVLVVAVGVLATLPPTRWRGNAVATVPAQEILQRWEPGGVASRRSKSFA